MTIDVIEKIERTIEKHRMLTVHERVIVAVSGGPDSMALLGALGRLSKAYALTLIVAHFNHGLRGERADAEEAFVRDVAEGMGLVCESLKSDIGEISRERKASIEETAREERYRFFEQVRCRYQAHKIALGHHRHDQAETILMNLLRGSGAEGLKGMRPVREGLYIRPLIELTREEIMAFLRSERRSFMIDDSNRDTRYLRNRIRHHLLPSLKADYNPRLEENLCQMAEILRLENDCLQREMHRILDDRQIFTHHGDDREIVIRIPDFLGLHEALQNRLIRHLLLKYAEAAQGIGYHHIRAVRHFIERPHPGGFLHLPFSIEIRREYDILVIGQRHQPSRRTLPAGHHGGERPGPLPGEDAAPVARDIDIPGMIDLREENLRLRFDFVEGSAVRFDCPGTFFMDYDRIVPPLTLRFPQGGDRIQPLGMAGTKKLKNVFIDGKFPPRIRRRMPLLADARSILCIIGHVISERVKITDKTTKFLKIEMI
jgi:tRNA(Ile)-lysidine synthase